MKVKKRKKDQPVSYNEDDDYDVDDNVGYDNDNDDDYDPGGDIKADYDNFDDDNDYKVHNFSKACHIKVFFLLCRII